MITATTRATPVLLWSRAALLAVVVLAVSVLGHVSADGLLPGPVALIALLALTTVVSARFLTRQASALRLVALLAVGQVVVHGMLTLLAGHRSGRSAALSADGAAGGSADVGGFVFDGRQAERTGSYFDQVAAMQSGAAVDVATGASGETLVASLTHLVEHLAAQNVAMLLAHLAAVAVLGLWLAVGERALWTVLTLTTSRVLGAVAVLVAVALADRVGVLLERVRRTSYLRSTGRLAVPLPHLLHHVVAHRGPPALLLPA